MQIKYNLPHKPENLFPNFKPDWKSIYLLPRYMTLDANLRMFQCKL